MKKIILVIGAALVLAPAFSGQGHNHTDEEAHFVKAKTFNFNNGKSKVNVVLRDDGHLIGHKFTVELRPLCNAADKTSWEDVKTQDSQSFCDMDYKSLKINKAGTAVAIKVKPVDREDYEKQMAKGSKNIEVSCSKKSEIHIFDLRKLCL